MSEPVPTMPQMRLPSTEQLGGPYLHTAEDLLPVEAIDLDPIRQPRAHTDLFCTNVGAVALFVSEHAEGEIDKERLSAFYARAIHTDYKVEELFGVMDAIEGQHPRVRKMLDIIRDTNIFIGNTYVDVVKTTWVMTAIRHAESQ